ncbi:MFS general substrate transporter [Auriculariales sp. MPI-PUGE-AT-0066]|nr:MFS general substrate transporter [Auriculariales sp. MPI-PUGE-AT-0066]
MQMPDGGLEAWLVVLAGWLIIFSTMGYVQAFGVFQSYYVPALGRSDSDVAWIGSFQMWLQLAAALVVGRLFDEGWGKRFLCKEYWQVFLAQGVGLGIGLATLFLPAVSVIPQWFKAKRALATGIMVSGSSVGGIVFPIMLNNLIETHGYAYAVRATGYLILGNLTIASVLIKFRIPGRKHRPPHMQLPPPDMGAIMRHTTYWVATAGVFLLTWGIFFPIFYLQVFAELHGISRHLAFYLLSITNAASIVGRIVPNFLADKFGPYNLLTTASTCAAILVFVFPLADSKGGIITFAILYGFFSGAYLSLTPSVFTALSSHLGEIGVRMGVAWTVCSLAALSGPPICGSV